MGAGAFVKVAASWTGEWKRFDGEPTDPVTPDEHRASQWDAAQKARAYLDSITPNADATPQDPPFEVRETSEVPPEGTPQ